MDDNTKLKGHLAHSAQFAKVSVDLDFTKPVVSKLLIQESGGRRLQQVNFLNLPIPCPSYNRPKFQPLVCVFCSKDSSLSPNPQPPPAGTTSIPTDSSPPPTPTSSPPDSEGSGSSEEGRVQVRHKPTTSRPTPTRPTNSLGPRKRLAIRDPPQPRLPIPTVRTHPLNSTATPTSERQHHFNNTLNSHTETTIPHSPTTIKPTSHPINTWHDSMDLSPYSPPTSVIQLNLTNLTTTPIEKALSQTFDITTAIHHTSTPFIPQNNPFDPLYLRKQDTLSCPNPLF